MNVLAGAADEPVARVIIMIAAFSETITKAVTAGSEASSLLHQHRSAYSAFKSDILATAPHFVPFSDPRHTPQNWEIGLFEDKDGGDDDNAERVHPSSAPFYLQDMREHLQKAITRELPGNVPFEAKASLMNKFQESWSDIVGVCFDRVYLSMRGMVAAHHTIANGSSQFSAVISKLLEDLMEQQKQLCIEHINVFLKIQRTPYTQHTQHLRSCTNTWLIRYKMIREKVDVQSKMSPITTTTNEAEPPQETTRLPSPQLPTPASSSQVTSTYVPSLQKSSRRRKKLGREETPKLFSQTPAVFLGSAIQRDIENSNFTQPLADPKLNPIIAKSSQDSPQSSDPATRQNMVPTSIHDPSTGRHVTFLSITAIPQYSSNSFEELRVVAYSDRATGTSVTHNSQSTIPLTEQGAAQKAVQSSIKFLEEMETAFLQEEKECAALALLAELGYSNITRADLAKLKPPELFENEIHAMAEIRAFFDVVCQRVIDTVPQFIDGIFVRGTAHELQSFLIQRLELESEGAFERCKGYISDES